MVTPDPLPNSAVKHISVDDSGNAKVDQRLDLVLSFFILKNTPLKVFLCYIFVIIYLLILKFFMSNKFMQKALEVAREHSFKLEGGPFGAVVVKNGEIISEGWNTVTTDNDPTCHAEVNAIRRACKKLNTFDLSDCEIYSSTEPCPMCLGAIYWAKLSALYFGNSRQDAAKIGFDDEFIYEELNKNIFERKLKTENGVMSNEVNKLFEDWKNLPGVKMY